MTVHVIRHGKRALVAGLNCSLHDNAAEAKIHAKESAAFNIQALEDGKLLLACSKEPLPKGREQLSASAFVGLAFSNAVIVHDIGDDDLVWVSAIYQGLPIPDGDQIVQRSEVPKIVAEHLTHISGTVIGTIEGAQYSLIDALDAVESLLQSKEISEKRIKSLALRTNGISIKQLIVVLLALAVLVFIAVSAIKYQSILSDKKRREKLLQELSTREEARKAKEIQRAKLIRDFNELVNQEKTKYESGGLALAQWKICDQIRRQTPFSYGGWIPMKLTCDFERGVAITEWSASIQQTSIEHREKLPNVVNAFEVEQQPKSEVKMNVEVTGNQPIDLPMPSIRLKLTGWANRNLQSLAVTSHQRTVLNPPEEIKDEPGIQAVVIGDKAEWSFNATGFTQRLTADQAVVVVSEHSSTLKSVIWSSLSKPEISVQATGVIYAKLFQ